MRTLLPAKADPKRPRQRPVAAAAWMLPAVSAVRARLSQGAQSHGEKDMSATYLTWAPRRPGEAGAQVSCYELSGSRRSTSRAMSSRADSAPTMAAMTEAQTSSGGSAVTAWHRLARPSSSGDSGRSTRPSV